jgi:hypothetical protein
VSLHLIKLCVGPDSLDELRAWQARRVAQGQPLIVHTRQTPKRAEEIIDGGSLYWVIKGLVAARQKVLAIDTLGEGGQKRCEIRLENAVVPTAPQPRRAFQGWRYFEPKDAPADLAGGEGGEAMPQELARQLREIGAW